MAIDKSRQLSANRRSAMGRLRLMFATVAVAVLPGCEDMARGGSEPMQISIPAFAAGQPIPRQFTCEGADLSPALEWSDPPAGTRSFALIVDDPDAPAGVFGHWGVYDIDAGARRFEEGAGSMAGASFPQARNDFGVQGYRGPCPPRGHGPHRYRFKLFALDIASLGVGHAPRIAELEKAMNGRILASASHTASYERN